MKRKIISKLILTLFIIITSCSKHTESPKKTIYKIPKSIDFDSLNGLGIRLLELSNKESNDSLQKIKMLAEIHNFNESPTKVHINNSTLVRNDGETHRSSEQNFKLTLEPKKSQIFQLTFSVPKAVTESFYIILLSVNDFSFFYPKEDPNRSFGDQKYEKKVYSFLEKLNFDTSFIYSQQEVIKEMEKILSDLSKQNPKSENRCTNYNRLKQRYQKLLSFTPPQQREEAVKVVASFKTILKKGNCIEVWEDNEGECSEGCNYTDCSYVANLAISEGDLKSASYYFDKAEKCYIDKTDLSSHRFDKLKEIIFPNQVAKKAYQKLNTHPNCNSLRECLLAARIYSNKRVEFSQNHIVMNLLSKACFMNDNKNDYHPCFLAASYFHNSSLKNAKLLYRRTFEIRKKLCLTSNDASDDSCYQLGLALKQGTYLGFPKNIRKARSYFKKACKKGHYLACRQIN